MELREDYLHRMAKSFEEEEIMTASRAVKHIRRQEKVKQANARINNVHRQWQPARVSKITRLNNDGLEEAIDDPSEFSRECREEWTRCLGLDNAALTMTPATVA